MYRKLECSLNAFIILLWFIGCQWLTISFLKFFLKLDTTLFLSYYSQHIYKVNALIQMICAIGILIFDGIIKRDSLTDYRFFKKKDIIRYFFYGILLWGFSSIINLLLSSIFIDYAKQVEPLFSSKEPIWRFLVLVILAPIVEEYLFRGKMQKTLERGFGIYIAIIIQGIVFGMIHPMNMQKVYASFLGIILGVIKQNEKNLQSSTIMHMTVNLVSWMVATL